MPDGLYSGFKISGGGGVNPFTCLDLYHCVSDSVSAVPVEVRLAHSPRDCTDRLSGLREHRPDRQLIQSPDETETGSDVNNAEPLCMMT